MHQRVGGRGGNPPARPLGHEGVLDFFPNSVRSHAKSVSLAWLRHARRSSPSPTIPKHPEASHTVAYLRARFLQPLSHFWHIRIHFCNPYHIFGMSELIFATPITFLAYWSRAEHRADHQSRAHSKSQSRAWSRACSIAQSRAQSRAHSRQQSTAQSTHRGRLSEGRAVTAKRTVCQNKFTRKKLKTFFR